MLDTNGRKWAKLSKLNLWDIVEVTGFDCMDGKRLVKLHPDGLYVDCDHGCHFLSGQLETDNDSLIGVYHVLP